MLNMATILKSKMATKREITSNLFIALLPYLVAHTWVLPPFCVCFMAHKLRYKLKYAENGDHFEFQDGRHRDIKSVTNLIFYSCGPPSLFKTKKYTISKMSNNVYHSLASLTWYCHHELCMQLTS